MADNNRNTVVTAYMRGNGLLEGFIDLELKILPTKNVTYLVDVNDTLFLARKTKIAIFTDPEADRDDADAIETIALYDVGLQHAPRGLIKCPYLLLRRHAKSKKYENLTLDHKQDIIATIDSLQEEQEALRETHTRRVVTTYHVASGRWSGLVPVIISETSNGNFDIPMIETFFPNTQNIKTCVIEVGANSSRRRFFCILDRTMHNNGTNECPYLLFRVGHGYLVQHATEDDIVDVADVIKRIKAELDNEANH